jgi:hypothetical protein
LKSIIATKRILFPFGHFLSGVKGPLNVEDLVLAQCILEPFAKVQMETAVVEIVEMRKRVEIVSLCRGCEVTPGWKLGRVVVGLRYERLRGGADQASRQLPFAVPLSPELAYRFCAATRLCGIPLVS